MMKTFKTMGILIVSISMGVLLSTGMAAAQYPQQQAIWISVQPPPYGGLPDYTYPTGPDSYGNYYPVQTIRVKRICDENGQNCKDVSYGWGNISNALCSPDGTQPNVVYVNSSANVGVGTTNPQSKFAVNGTITAKEVKVTQTGWSDYVFAEDYRLLPLDKLESYVNQEKHLPGIPSAKEVEEKGLAISDTLSKQMQKIEELTLYLIQLKKNNEELTFYLTQLKKDNEELKERITALEQEK